MTPLGSQSRVRPPRIGAICPPAQPAARQTAGAMIGASGTVQNRRKMRAKPRGLNMYQRRRRLLGVRSKVSFDKGVSKGVTPPCRGGPKKPRGVVIGVVIPCAFCIAYRLRKPFRVQCGFPFFRRSAVKPLRKVTRQPLLKQAPHPACGHGPARAIAAHDAFRERSSAQAAGPDFARSSGSSDRRSIGSCHPSAHILRDPDIRSPAPARPARPRQGQPAGSQFPQLSARDLLRQGSMAQGHQGRPMRWRYGCSSPFG